MSPHPNKIVLFFQELRRRRVFKTLAMYAATAFILMEASDIMLPRLGLPEWTVTFVIVLLIAGFPIALILSWIFDLTPKGIQKTPTVDEAAQSLGTAYAISQKKGFTVSHAIIVILLVVVCILLYPKLFSGDHYQEIRNESGQISLVVLPFENQTGDSSLDWFSRGISSLLTNGLGSSEQLLVYNDQGVGEIMDGMREINTAGLTVSQARDIATKARAQSYVTGSFQGRGDTYRILARLVSTENDDILLTHQVEGNLNSDDCMDLVDSLCNLIRDQLEIRVLEKQADFDFRQAFTSSAEAYRYYIEGMNALVRADFAYAVELLEKSMEIDSTFAFAAFSIAMAYNMETSSLDQAQAWVDKANELKGSLPLVYQMWIELWDLNSDIPTMERQLAALESSGIESRIFWFDLGVTYQSFTGNFEKAREAFEKVREISERRGSPWGFWKYYQQYGAVLHELGRHEEENAVRRQALELFPEDRLRKEFFYWSAVCAISTGDSLLTARHIKDYLESKKALGEFGRNSDRNLCNIYFFGKDYKKAEAMNREFIAKYSENVGAKFMLGRTLIEGDLDPEEGLALMENHLKKYPESMAAKDLSAWALHKLGSHQEALDHFERNDAQDPYFSLYRYLWMEEVRESLSGSS